MNAKPAAQIDIRRSGRTSAKYSEALTSDMVFHFNIPHMVNNILLEAVKACR